MYKPLLTVGGAAGTNVQYKAWEKITNVYTWRIVFHTEFLAGGDVGIVSEDSDSGSIESVDRESCLQLYLNWLEGVSDDQLKNIFLEKVFLILRCMSLVANWMKKINKHRSFGQAIQEYMQMGYHKLYLQV